MKAIDLFAGCGGLSLGFIKNGYEITTAVEFDRSIAETYKKNHEGVNVIVDDIKNIDTSEVFKKNDADVIIGGPPCQGFSMAGARIRNGFIDDPRNYLFKHYFNVVKKVKPQVFIMENVKGLLTMHNGEIFKEIVSSFSDPNLLDGEPYHINYKLVKAVDFGIPQKRERVIIVGSIYNNFNFEELWLDTIEDIKKEIPNYFDSVTVKDAIGNLGNTTEDGISKLNEEQSEYEKFLSNGKNIVTNHNKTNHSKVAIERMSKIKSGENFKSLNEEIKSVHSGAYGRLSWDSPAQTITTRFDTPAGGRFIHPVENRTLSPREAARIQSFPDDFIFYGNKTSIGKQIGNAVPPKISYFLSRLVDKIIEEGKNESNTTK
ncbi:DNA cytosine methyltransferase [Helcococcus massiliensis]|uniref:DNA cytosine methyltransferase n=1 Tax=Helcococcus massiliensis TaxID=2040290 RepID=UPI000CDE62AF|nr:DNA cytosine methyltransferase [Helcococcus massiliensis]